MPFAYAPGADQDSANLTGNLQHAPIRPPYPFLHRLVHTRLDLRVAALVAETQPLNPKTLKPKPYPKIRDAEGCQRLPGDPQVEV